MKGRNMKKIAIITTFIFCFILSGTVVAKKSYSQTLCKQYGYRCYKVKRHDSWRKLFPNAEQRDLVKRINRMNVRLRRGRIIAIPDDLHRTDLFEHSPFADVIDSKGRTVVIIDLKHQAFAAYDENGMLVHWGPVSGGKGWCPDIRRRCNTPRGTFYFIRKGGPGCVSSRYPRPYGGSKMPYCMFFKGNFAMHGSTLPGWHASHGCVRMMDKDAKWLNRGFITLGSKGTVVIVK
jgi:L,D-transpeptidase ErfK/SrfK